MAMPEFVADSVTDSVFSLKLWQSLYFVKLQSLTMNGNSVSESASKVLDLSYKHESSTKNGSDEVCARVCFW